MSSGGARSTRNPIAFLRLGLALMLFASSLLTVLRAPSYNLWKLSVVVTEWGHFLALASLLLLFPAWSRSRIDRAKTVVTIATIALFLSPLVRAWPVARAVASVFGDATPSRSSGEPALSAPLRLRGLFLNPAASDVRRTTAVYAVRGGESLAIDLYRRNGNRAAEPLVVVIHGGSWAGGARSDLPALNSYLAARGYVVAAPGYRFAPRFRHPAQSDDIAAAIAFLKSEAAGLGIDSTRIAIIGRSAGGQLALMSAYAGNDRSIRGVVAFYAPTDQKWGWANPSDPRVYDSFAALRAFLGGSPAENPEGYRTSSPLEHVGSATVPTLLIHGSRDEIVSSTQSARLDSALSANGRPHLYLELPWATHGCDFAFNGPCGQISTYAIERFLASVMSP